jgi:putative pyoverdin transport system ATP-binding/permease protein
MMALTGVAALLSGACNAGLIAAVNAALNTTDWIDLRLVVAFGALAGGKLVFGYLSQYMLTSFAQTAAARLREDLVGKILAVPLRHLEELGTARIMVSLTDDVSNITQALLGMPLLGVNLAILLGGACYLGFLSWKILLLLCGFIVVGALGYRMLINRGFYYLHRAREVEDQLFQHFRGLTEGMKELKLHRRRREMFLGENVQSATREFQVCNVAGEKRFILAQTWSHLLFFVLLASLVFILPRWEHVDRPTLTGYVITTLYLMGPLAGVLNSFSLFSRANISLQKVQGLGVSLSGKLAEHFGSNGGAGKGGFGVLELAGVTHAYHHEAEGHEFVLGPIDLVLPRGQVVFLAGGNGSGKSTLAKIITGLYPPETGEVRLDGVRITDGNRDDYRQMFTAVFSDFYLFESLLGLESANLDKRARRYLEQLQLHHKVAIKNGRLSTTSLSQGQRKRLALLTAYLEDRAFYLFDEWASDQDPYFKEIFYTQLLPELKGRGKTVFVITHDDKYYGLADRLVKLESGKVTMDREGGGVDTETVRRGDAERAKMANGEEKSG